MGEVQKGYDIGKIGIKASLNNDKKNLQEVSENWGEIYRGVQG